MDVLTEWPLTLSLALSILCIFVYTTLTSKSYKLPPSPLKLPILGNLHQMLGQPPYEALWKLSKQYGPVMQFHIGSRPFLVISSATMAKQVVKTQDHIFCSRGLYPTTKRFTYNFQDVSFSPNSAHWREMRKLLVSEFTGPKRAKLSNSVFVAPMESMIRSLSLHPPNTELNLSNMILETVKQIMCKVTLGDNYKAHALKGPSFDVILEDAIDLLNGSVGDIFPFLGYYIDQFTGWNRRMNDGFKKLDAYFDAIIDDHLKHDVEEQSEEDKDFVRAFLEKKSSEENDSGYPLTHTHLKALLLDILVGAIDTTTLTVTWAMSEIIKNTRVLQKLQSEIRNCMGRIHKVDELDITKMNYLKMVVKETLRLHPPLPLLLPHLSLSQTQIAGYDVFPNTGVLINIWGIARDPSTWGENATEFYPERFENLDGDFGRDKFEMLPFGGGRRSCPAMNTAPLNVEFMIANLLYWFDWELPSGIKNEELNMEVDPGAFVLAKKVPLCVVATKPKWED